MFSGGAQLRDGGRTSGAGEVFNEKKKLKRVLKKEKEGT